MLNKAIYIFLRLLLGAFFLYSAFSKAVDIDAFDMHVIQSGLIPWKWISSLTFLIIFTEYAIGLYYVLIPLRSKIIEYFSLAVLIIFSGYLGYLYLKFGNSIDCGCMGRAIKFTPLQGIAKNAICALLLVILLLHKVKFNSPFKLVRYAFFAIPLLSLTTTAYQLPLDFNFNTSYILNKNTPLKYQVIQEKGMYHKPDFDFSKPKYVVAFLSLTCAHCQIAADKFNHLLQKDKAMPLLLVLNGDSQNVNPYLLKFGLQNCPNTLLLGKNFIELAGKRLPVIYLVEKGTIKKQINHRELDFEKLEKWLNN